jgi:hypothetical protein
VSAFSATRRGPVLVSAIHPLAPIQTSASDDAHVGQVTSRRPLTVQRLSRAGHGHHGNLYERSHVPLSKWLAATRLIMASKKG